MECEECVNFKKRTNTVKALNDFMAVLPPEARISIEPYVPFDSKGNALAMQTRLSFCWGAEKRLYYLQGE